MTREDILAELSTYLEEYFEVSKEAITLDSKLYEELNLDSIDAVDLIVKLQEITKQKIAPADFKEVRTVGDVVEKVYALIHK
ncbi:acyl carrier protein [Candidatus Odyssella thessalonicensis]|uniref:acyl carrier protein n=1 Tax=Candidatus Odyssella thessalonicensis TaxID=84647 RepID=UPI000225BF9D|nr:acyl carrier protein [Candidatus Odyssella thessalonicensis]